MTYGTTLRWVASLPVPIALAACASSPAPQTGYRPPIGSNEVFRLPTAAAPGHELILADLNLPANATGEAHYHLWEEYLYILEGSAIVDIEGQPSRTMVAGESIVIPPRAVHTPRAGPQGIRAIVARVHDEGDPVSIPAPPEGQPAPANGS